KLIVMVVIADVLRFISPSSFNHLEFNFPLTVWALLLLAGLCISLVFIYILKFFFEKSLLVSVSDECLKIWRGDKWNRDIFFESIQQIEFGAYDIFIHYQENRVQKILALSETEQSLKEEVLAVKKKFSL